MLSERRDILTAVAIALASAGSLAADECASIMATHGLIVDVRPEGFQWLPAYEDTLAGRQQADRR